MTIKVQRVDGKMSVYIKKDPTEDTWIPIDKYYNIEGDFDMRFLDPELILDMGEDYIRKN